MSTFLNDIKRAKHAVIAERLDSAYALLVKYGYRTYGQRLRTTFENDPINDAVKEIIKCRIELGHAEYLQTL